MFLPLIFSKINKIRTKKGKRSSPKRQNAPCAVFLHRGLCLYVFGKCIRKSYIFSICCDAALSISRL